MTPPKSFLEGVQNWSLESEYNKNYFYINYFNYFMFIISIIYISNHYNGRKNPNWFDISEIRQEIRAEQTISSSLPCRSNRKRQREKRAQLIPNLQQSRNEADTLQWCLRYKYNKYYYRINICKIIQNMTIFSFF